MIKSNASKVTSFLFDNNYIDNIKYDYEVYLYGFEILIASILNLATTLLIGVIFDKFIHTIVFLICYCSLRQFSGGYHSNTYKNCYITFILIFISTILIANHLDSINLKPLIILFSVLNWICICLQGPVEHINNPLTYLEFIKYYRYVIFIATLVLLFIVINNKYFIYSSLALFWINILMNIEFIKNRRI